MVIIANLPVSSRVIPVRLLVGYFFKHGVDENVDACIFLNQILELLKHRMEFLGIIFHAVDDS